jgi:hypothetical protein
MDLNHSDLNTPWKHLNRAASQLPTNASAWTKFLKDLYNNGELRGPVACPQKVSDACKLQKDEIAGAIRKLPKGKTPGPDGVRAENITEEQSDLLTELWRRIAQEGSMPRFLNDTLIYPIHKKGDFNEPANFRPISLLNTAVKIFELAVLDKFKEGLLRSIPNEQFGLNQEYALSTRSRC